MTSETTPQPGDETPLQPGDETPLQPQPHDETTPDAAGRPSRRGLIVGVSIVAAVALVAVGTGIAVVQSDVVPFSAQARPAAAPVTPSASDEAGPVSTATATATPTPSPTPSPRAATAVPDPAVPDPFVTSVAAGTVVAENDVVSPKGSIRYHYRVVANGDDTYSAEYTNYTSTLPVPVSVAFLEIAPSVGDGLTASGPGETLLGGPTSSPGAATTPLQDLVRSVSQPSYLGSLVTYSSTSDPSVPIEIGTLKVLAVEPVRWSVPVRETNIVPVDGGAVAFAEGGVTATTTSGAPRRYLVAPGDSTALVAQRFGISVAALIYLNRGLQVLDAEQHLYEGTTLNLDPDSV